MTRRRMGEPGSRGTGKPVSRLKPLAASSHLVPPAARLTGSPPGLPAYRLTGQPVSRPACPIGKNKYEQILAAPNTENAETGRGPGTVPGKMVPMNIYAGSLSFQLTEADLKAAFEAYGTVSSARIIMDRYSGRSKGFGFVEMANDTEAKAAIAAMNGKELKGRKIMVSEAKPR